MLAAFLLAPKRPGSSQTSALTELIEEASSARRQADFLFGVALREILATATLQRASSSSPFCLWDEGE